MTTETFKRCKEIDNQLNRINYFKDLLDGHYGAKFLNLLTKKVFCLYWKTSYDSWGTHYFDLSWLEEDTKKEIYDAVKEILDKKKEMLEKELASY